MRFVGSSTYRSTSQEYCRSTSTLLDSNISERRVLWNTSDSMHFLYVIDGNTEPKFWDSAGESSHSSNVR